MSATSIPQPPELGELYNRGFKDGCSAGMKAERLVWETKLRAFLDNHPVNVNPNDLRALMRQIAYGAP